MKKNYTFKPHIPNNFGQSELGRLLLVGDSHYILGGIKDLSNFTKGMIKELGEYTPHKFYREVGKVFNPENYLEVYSKVAFVNAIQNGMESSDQKPNEEDFKTVEPAIREYLEEIKPDKMIVFSKRVWENGLPGDITWGRYIETIVDDSTNYKATVWQFNYTNGRCYGIGVYHPSYRRFSAEKMKSLLGIFFSKNYE